MAKTEAAPVEEQAEATNMVELKGALTKKLDEAREALGKLQAEFAAAMDAKDMKAALELAPKISVAERNVEKAEKAVKDADFEARTAERMEVTTALQQSVKATIEAYLANEPRVLELGMKAITVALNPDGSCNVSVTGPSRPSGGTGEKRKASNGTGESKPRAMWTLAFEGGRQIGSADLLTEFGGDEGPRAIDRARNYEAYGMKFSPGFDQPVKKLAKSMGWDGGEERILTHLPE